MALIEGISYSGSETCEPVFPTQSPWRLLTKGYKMCEDTMHRYMDHVIQTMGYSDDQPLLSPDAAGDASVSTPYYFSVTTKEQKNDHWLPFIVSNYPRDAQGFAVLGAQGWSLRKQLLASCAA